MTLKKKKQLFFLANALFFGTSAIYLCGFLFGIIPKSFCPFPRFLGVYCPACGGTRATIALFQGKILTSLLYHPASLVLWADVLYYEVAVWRWMVGRGKRVRLFPLVLLAAALLLHFAVRNILLLCFGIDLIGDLRPRPESLTSFLYYIGL